MTGTKQAPENHQIKSELDDALKNLLGFRIKESYSIHLQNKAIDSISIGLFFNGIIITYDDLSEKERKKWRIIEYLRDPKILGILEKVRGNGNKGKFTLNYKKLQEYFQYLISLGILNQSDECISGVAAKVEEILRKPPTS